MKDNIEDSIGDNIRVTDSIRDDIADIVRVGDDIRDDIEEIIQGSTRSSSCSTRH
jgi:hypothetical protein